MILIPYFWLFTRVISVSESAFIAFPASNWTTADSVCTLPSIDNIKTNDLINVITTAGGTTEKAWTGTRVKYSKWAAFIGCDVEIFGSADKSDIKRVQDCLLHCSEDTEASYFAVQNSKCKCLRDKPKSTTESLYCRKKCANPMDTPCGSGISAMVFVITKDIEVKAEKYFENECVKATADLKSYEVTNCSATLFYGCINTTGIFTEKTWYEYQEECFKSDIVPKYNSVNIHSPQPRKFYWAPIFRTHLVLDGVNERNQKCLAVENSTLKYTTESCDSVYPFICSKSGRRLKDQNGAGRSSLRFITLPISVVAANGIFIIVLLLIIVIISTKLKMAKQKSKQMIVDCSDEMDGFPDPPNSSAKLVRIRETYIEASDAPVRSGHSSYNDVAGFTSSKPTNNCYNEVYDDVNKTFKIKS